MTKTSLVLRYSTFAVIATIVNLAVQRIILAMHVGDAGLLLAIFIGTVVGLLVKFQLDKRWIFFDANRSKKGQARQFALYTLMGIATTAIFWGMEYSFWIIWRTDLMRELGAIIGLAIGYVTKYHLDKRLVFAPMARTGAA